MSLSHREGQEVLSLRLRFSGREREFCSWPRVRGRPPPQNASPVWTRCRARLDKRQSAFVPLVSHPARLKF